MTSHRVRSGRTVVLGDSPVARGIREALAARTGSRAVGAREPGCVGEPCEVARSVSEPWTDAPVEPAAVPSDAPEASLAGAQAVVLVGQTGDFAAVEASRVVERQEEVARGVRAAVAAGAAAGVEHVVGISSAMVDGPAPDRGLVDDSDDSALDDGTYRPASDADTGDGGAAGDLKAFEAALVGAVAEHGIAHLTVLRPAVLVGPGVDTLLTRHFEAPRILTVRGARRDWQLVHVDDLGAAVALVVGRRLTGVLTVGAVRDGAPDVLSPEEVVDLTGLRTVDLPAAVAFGTAERLHRLGVLPAPASDLACTVYPWTVTSRRLVAAGWAPAWSSAACLEVLVEQARGRLGVGGRRVARRDAAALGAAGAAVALLGTAAVWRQARGRR